MNHIKVDFLLQPTPIHKFKKKIESGQSSIEFLISFFFVIGFVFVFLKIAMNATEGYVVHYATYMASRSYLVAEQNSNQVNNSSAAFTNGAKKAYQSIFQTGINNLKESAPMTTETNIFVGVFTKYKRKLSAGIVGSGRSMQLISESYLGREPTKEECRRRICDAFSLPGGACGLHSTIFDNGC